MKFSRVIGKIDPKIIAEAQTCLSKVFLEMALKFDSNVVKDGIGGDPFLFTLLQPMQHIATLNMPTAATDGVRYYWNPEFVIKQSRQGLRLICSHEALHAIYMHPTRRKGRHPKLWNICVDFIVNGVAMQDLKIRKKNAGEYFQKYLGNFLTLSGYVEHIKNPFLPLPGIENFIPEPDEQIVKVDLPKPDEERDLTDKERQEIDRLSKKYKYFYADPDLPKNMMKPERMYDYLYRLLPKCPDCGKLGLYKYPETYEEINHDHGYDYCDFDNDYEESHSHHNYYDIFNSGDLLDEHMDSSETPEKMARRLADAMHNAKTMAGSVPAGIEEELGQLMAPKIRLQDFIRSKLVKARAGNAKNDWSKFRSRQLFIGLLTPKKKNNFATAGVLLDCSGSMSKEDRAYAISQLQSLDERSELTLVCCDSEIYWDKSIKLRNLKKDTLQNIKTTGNGGTYFGGFFTDYEKHIGKCDFLIILTDGYLSDTDVAAMIDPSIPVYWIITSDADFQAPFGKVFSLKDM